MWAKTGSHACWRNVQARVSQAVVVAVRIQAAFRSGPIHQPEDLQLDPGNIQVEHHVGRAAAQQRRGRRKGHK